MAVDFFPLIIIGGGPAGLMAACAAREDKTLLIERGPKPGRKLLVTAAGQCNMTHKGTIPELLSCYNGKEKFLRPALYDFSNDHVIAFFADRGVPSFFDEKGRCLPESLSARDVLHALLTTAREKGTNFNQGDRVIAVESIAESSAGARFRIITKLREYTCHRLILATGGKSYPKTGSTGDGYDLARALGHRINDPRPALTGMESDVFPLTSLAGLSFDNRTVELYRNGKMAHRFTGNLLITHKGLSGPVIINNSRDMAAGDEVRVNFAGPGREELTSLMTRTDGKKTLGTLLKELAVPRKFIQFLLDTDGLSGNVSNTTLLSQLKKSDRNHLLALLTAFPLPLSRLQGWATAMVTAGGIETKEINPKTMESRIVPGLYFAGEIIDIDGDSGGYNLQAAFSTGRLAGKQ